MRRNIESVLVGYEHFSNQYRSASLNHLQDEASNWSKGLTTEHFCTMQQVHEDTINIAKRDTAIASCDGLITDDPDIVLLGTFADCVPIAFWDDQGHRGLCHAGWRGTALRIAPKLMQRMHETYGSEQINVWIGPCICPDHYEVSKDFDELSRPHSHKAFFMRAQKAYFDLVEENRAQVQASPWFKALYLDNECTFEHAQYHSHRRNGVERGRNVAFITAQSED